MIAAQTPRLRARLATTCAAALVLAACSSAKPPPPKPVEVPRTLEIALQASPSLNPDARERASPVVVRIYELKAPLSFQAADFFALFEKDQATLGADLVAREELQLRPGESRTLSSRELKPEVRALGVFAAFRDLERSQWRTVIALPEPPAPTPTPPARPVPVSVSVTLGARDVRAALK